MPRLFRIPAAVLAIGGGVIIMMYSDPAGFDFLARAVDQVIRSFQW